MIRLIRFCFGVCTKSTILFLKAFITVTALGAPFQLTLRLYQTNPAQLFETSMGWVVIFLIFLFLILAVMLTVIVWFPERFDD